MPITSFLVRSVSEPERRQNRRTREWFPVWTIERMPDVSLSVAESMAGYETSSPWLASLCEQARVRAVPVTVLWREGPWLRIITDVTVAKASAA